MPTIYLLVVKQPPGEKACLNCQFEEEYRCIVAEGRWLGMKAQETVPEWCPLQIVEVPE